MARFDWRKIAGLFRTDPVGSTGSPDFPDSAGDRERGKFRPSEYPRLDTVAVVDDDGTRIGTALMPSLDTLTEEVRKLRLALTLNEVATDLGDLDTE